MDPCSRVRIQGRRLAHWSPPLCASSQRNRSQRPTPASQHLADRIVHRAGGAETVPQRLTQIKSFAIKSPRPAPSPEFPRKVEDRFQETNSHLFLISCLEGRRQHWRPLEGTNEHLTGSRRRGRGQMTEAAATKPWQGAK